jgi:hypothetical protein
MKIKELLTKIALCIIPTMLSIFAFSFENEMKSGEAAFLVSGIATSNITFIVMYVFLKRDEITDGDEKMSFLSKRIDTLIAINQVCLVIILLLFYYKYSGIISLTEAYIFIILILYGNYYSLLPMPTENISVYFEDEDIWRKVRSLRSKLFFGFGVVGLLIVLYFSPKGLGLSQMLLIYGIMFIVFIITYFYAKQQYNRKFDS